jgi:hypothetical protein
MNLFLAAVYTTGLTKASPTQYNQFTDEEKVLVDTIPNILESYHYVHSQRRVDQMRANGAQVFLDSGAFSAHSLGVQISIDDYCQYIIRNDDIIRKEDGIVMASVLDGIGDPLLTWQNQIYMEEHGAKPLPCFHFGEDDRYLEWYVSKYEYITLGGLVGKSFSDASNWLDRIWNKYLIDGSGRPRLKVHAFGVTALELMKRYPWFSVDSSSWIQITAFGNIMTDTYGMVSVSDKSPSRHDAGRHFLTYTPQEQQALRDYFARDGFDPDRMSTSWHSRAAYNILSYNRIADQINAQIAAGRLLDCHKVQQLF